MSTDVTTTTNTSPLAGLAATNGIFTTVKGDDFQTKTKSTTLRTSPNWEARPLRSPTW